MPSEHLPQVSGELIGLPTLEEGAEDLTYVDVDQDSPEVAFNQFVDAAEEVSSTVGNEQVFPVKVGGELAQMTAEQLDEALKAHVGETAVAAYQGNIKTWSIIEAERENFEGSFRKGIDEIIHAREKDVGIGAELLGVQEEFNEGIGKFLDAIENMPVAEALGVVTKAIGVQQSLRRAWRHPSDNLDDKTIGQLRDLAQILPQITEYDQPVARVREAIEGDIGPTGNKLAGNGKKQVGNGERLIDGLNQKSREGRGVGENEEYFYNRHNGSEHKAAEDAPYLDVVEEGLNDGSVKRDFQGKEMIQEAVDRVRTAKNAMGANIDGLDQSKLRGKTGYLQESMDNFLRNFDQRSADDDQSVKLKRDLFDAIVADHTASLALTGAKAELEAIQRHKNMLRDTPKLVETIVENYGARQKDQQDQTKNLQALQELQRQQAT